MTEEQHNIRLLTPEEVTKTKDKVARELYEEIYSNGKVVVENTTEKATKTKNKAANRVNYMELDNGWRI